ncbi:MAG: monovalent cation/H+ antiporter subunit A [Alcanivoracaceae bacterium]|nr:monovalent cation/H+ antiporter subunit A [Alcanivoracaceae bacterium]
MSVLFAIVLLPLVAALLPRLVQSMGRPTVAIVTALPVLLALLLLLGTAPSVLVDGELLQAAVPWLPQAGLVLAFRLDGLAWLFALLILGIGLLVIVYGHYYLDKSDSGGRFFSLLLLFMSAMLGVVCSDNLLLLVVFWELTSISSFLLIGYWSGQAAARKGARMALTLTGAGGLALLAGVILIGQTVGSYDLGTVLASGELIRSDALYPLMLVLVLLGVFTKSAQFPFHFWLPHAMSAPTPVSAYLHSATMVKAGVFLLARFYPALAGTDLWFVLVSSIGLVTLLLGAWMALFRHDLKGLLAYSTISHLGLITLLFGLSTRLAAVAAVFHVINHATFKASLFMAAGIIDHETGTRDIRKLGGLRRYLPHTMALATVASMAMAGVPLLNGFLSKEMFFAEAADTPLYGSLNWLVPALATIAGMLSVAYSLRFIHDVFFGPVPAALAAHAPHEPRRLMRVPVEILVMLCLAVGVFPAVVVGPLLAAAATATLGGELPEYSLAIWHGFNVPLLMSLLALTGGVAIYVWRAPLFALQRRWPRPHAPAIFEQAVQLLVAGAGRFVRFVDNGALQRYVSWLMLPVALIMLAAIASRPDWLGEHALTPVDGLSILATIVAVLAALATVVLRRQRLVALLMISVVGLIVSLAFLRLSAPDLALTQLSVEVVTVLLLMLAMYFLPNRGVIESTWWDRSRDLFLSLSIGVGVGLLALFAMTHPGATISTFFIDNSIPGGGGANVVNVILVDFRGFDTLGEITVLAIAAAGIYALLENLGLCLPIYDSEGRPWAKDRSPLVLQMISRAVLPIALLVAMYILVRGHNMPGGGFIAGLITAVALVLQYVASGVHWVHARVPHNYHPLVAFGVLLAALTGLASLPLGYPFLTSTFEYIYWPVVGKFELASAMLFDLGVYITVVGATLLILARLGKLSVAEQEESN